MIPFILGTFVGVVLGFFTMALLCMAGANDKQ